jgi:hypothetical protein
MFYFMSDNLSLSSIGDRYPQDSRGAASSKYMTNLANHRGENLDPPLDVIDDTRNVILLVLYSTFHRIFGGLWGRISACQLLL